jgi:hypothetical protein
VQVEGPELLPNPELGDWLAALYQMIGDWLDEQGPPGRHAMSRRAAGQYYDREEPTGQPLPPGIEGFPLGRSATDPGPHPAARQRFLSKRGTYEPIDC